MDDDTDVCSRVKDYLNLHDFRVSVAKTGKQVLEMIARDPIDLLVMELRLRGDDGLRLARDIRQASKLPIVVLSDLIEEADRVLGLEMGADDYLTKPFSTRELLARIRAVLRRSNLSVVVQGRDETLRGYRFAGWELNVKLHKLSRPDGCTVDISRGEFSLLSAFLSSPQRIHSRDQLLDLSRVHSTEVYDRSIDVQVARLRRKIEADATKPRLLRTERGVGYFFDASVQVVR